jgi:hypothetical protein
MQKCLEVGITLAEFGLIASPFLGLLVERKNKVKKDL